MNRDTILDLYQAIDPEATAAIFDAPVDMGDVPESCPYAFPARTVGEVVDFLLIGRAYNATGFREGSPLSWNVKAYRYDVNGDDSEHKRNPELDGAWEAYLNTRKGEHVHGYVFEAAQEYYRHEWTSYPGDDQGDWEFAFYGRSGGHLCLVKWRGHDFSKMDRWDYYEFIAALIDDKKYLVQFYKAICCADREFTGENASKEVTHHYGFERARWEEERAEIVDKLTDSMLTAAYSTCKDYGVELTDDLLAKALSNAKAA